MRHTQPEHDGEPCLGCLIGFSILAGLAALGYGGYHLSTLGWQVLQSHF